MKIRFSKQFGKQLGKLTLKDKDEFWRKLEWFKEDIYDPRLRNHALKGKFVGTRSIDIKGDLRAIYEVVDDNIYIYLLIGTHSQLYR